MTITSSSLSQSATSLSRGPAIDSSTPIDSSKAGGTAPIDSSKAGGTAPVDSSKAGGTPALRFSDLSEGDQKTILDKIRQDFDQMAGDDGFLSISELKAFLKARYPSLTDEQIRQRADAFFNEGDADKSGTLTFNEYFRN